MDGKTEMNLWGAWDRKRQKPFRIIDIINTFMHMLSVKPLIRLLNQYSKCKRCECKWMDPFTAVDIALCVTLHSPCIPNDEKST